MIRTVWVRAHNIKKGKWEEYEEPTGEVKKGLFGGEKSVMVKKKRWIELNEIHENLIDGARLSKDTEAALIQLTSEGYEVLNITPVLSGRYSWTGYSSAGPGNNSASTCASWGYSVTEGVMITAKLS
jgi:hypothetical protein